MVPLTLALFVATVAGAAPADALPIRPDASTVLLDEIGLYRVGYRLDGKEERHLPVGWVGHFVDPSGVSCTPFGEHEGRAAFLLHCPWRDGTGVAFQEFAFVTPQASRIRLSGKTAMRSDAVGKSDGVTFRVIVNDQTLVERHQADADWRPFEVTLTPSPGLPLRIRFETDPGPDRNPSFDFSLWTDRTITFEGFRPPAVRRPSPPQLDLRQLVNTKRTSVIPPNAFQGRNAVILDGGKVRLTYRGPDGALQFTWNPSVGPLGSFELRSRMTGDRACRLSLADSASVVWSAPAERLSTDVAIHGAVARSVTRYRVNGAAATLTTEVSIQGKSLILDVRCDQGVIASLDFGGWGPVLRRRTISVPYYGSVAHASHEGLFLNAFLDWTRSSASYHTGVSAYYSPRTDGTRNVVRERAVFVAAWHLPETFPSIPNPPSPFRQDVGRRIVLDVWGGRYRAIADSLEVLHSFGLRDCVVLIHDWQRSGYDNALPMHLPAAEDKGGDPDLVHLVRTATHLGCRIALHENYVDYYPNYDHYDESHIALDPSGSKVLAWYNPGTRIQSYAVKPNAILPLAETQSPEIHRRFGTNASYLDVHSAVPPWFHVDHRAGEDGAGTFARVFEAHSKLFAYERRTHGGPVFGEGNAHWYWSGLLDGVEAQFGTGWPANAGLTAPLMPEFNLLKVHPLQINHGQGYYERWWANMPWGAVPTMDLLDQYRMQEIVFGHAGFLGASAWNIAPLAWLEHHLVTPVTARHSASTVRAVSYFVDGRWVDSTTAARLGQWTKPRIEYANGLTIVANGGDEPWRVYGATLPKHGWLARGAGVTAYTAFRDDVICDYAETRDSVFANARRASDWRLGGRLPVRPRVSEFRQTGPRTFEVTYAWSTRSTIREDYVAFVHFNAPTDRDYDEGIRFQQDHPLPRKTSEWKANETVTDGPYSVTIPDDVEDGTYSWTIGLYQPQGQRAVLEGPMDRSGRIVLGELRITGGGSHIEFTPKRAEDVAPADAGSSRVNEDGRMVTFASVRTNGSVLIRRDGSDWVLYPLPREGSFTVELNNFRFPVPDRILCEGGRAQEVRPSMAGHWWMLTLNGAQSYRWKDPTTR